MIMKLMSSGRIHLVHCPLAVGAEPVKQQQQQEQQQQQQQRKQTDNTNVNPQPQPVDQNTKQQEKPVQTSSAAGDQNIEVQMPKVGSESKDGDHQQNAGVKDQKVPNSETSDSDASEDKTSSDSEKTSVKPKKQDISVNKVQSGGDASLGIKEAAIEETIESNNISNQTAVIVLALGLGITAILLIFVGCRLRNVKRRLRKGRPMNSNEADYLINGMYL